MTDTTTKTAEPVTIKKYANRRLYNTASSSYVTLEHLSEMVKQNIDFVVYDAQDVAAGPIATARVPRRVPFGFHGNWRAA